MKVFIENRNEEFLYDFIGDLKVDSYPQMLAHPLVSERLRTGELYKFTGYIEDMEKAINVIPTDKVAVDMIFISKAQNNSINKSSHSGVQSPLPLHANTNAPSGEYAAIAAGVAAAIAAAAGVAVATTAMIVVGYIVATIIVIGISMLLGEVMKMLSPSQKAKTSDSLDAAIAQKNLLFNGIQNSVNQGCGVPLIFGECLFGGVVISKRLSTTDMPANIGVSNALIPYQWVKLS